MIVYTGSIDDSTEVVKFFRRQESNLRALRKLVVSLPPGGVSGPIHSQEGYRILKVISKEPAGQRELNDPRVQQSIRNTLLNRKDSLLRAAYYEVARNTAKVTNYLAQSIMQNAEKAK